MKTDTHKNVETLRQIFSADKLDTSVLDRVLDTDTLLKIAKDGNDLANKNNEIRAHTDVPSYPDPNGKTINSYVCEITIAPTPNENGLGMSWFENSLEDINKDLLSLGLQEIEDIGETHTVRKHGIDIKIIVKYVTGEYDKRYESYSIPEIKSKFDEKLKEAIKKSTVKTGSYRRNNMKKTIKSGRFIKSGTSNFVSNDGGFPLVVYMAEEYVYDEETDTQTEERDYDLENLDYEDAISNAEDIAEEKGISLCKGSFSRSLNGGDDYSSPYNVGITSGYYEGIQIQIEDNGSFDPEYMAQDDYDYTHDDSFYDLPQEEQDRLTSETEEKLVKEQEDKINDFLNELCTGYGWIKLGVTARFSNGETMYTKIDNSRKSVISGLTFRQAVQDFKAAGQWNDYYEMQQDWEAYKDGLERDGVISEKTRSTWGNPCTPEGFKRWIDNSYTMIQSRITQRELKDMIRTGQAIDITYGDAPEGVRLDVLQISKGTYGMNGALFKGSDGNLYVIGGRTTNLFRYV